LQFTSTNHQVRLGIRAHDLGRFSACKLARRVASGGFDCVQLALGKALEGVDFSSGVISDACADEVREAFRSHKVGIEVLGCYINPIHPDLEVRRSLLNWFKEHLRQARRFGCNLVALESCSLNADHSRHPGNHGEEAFAIFLTSMRELVSEAASYGVVVGIEAVTSHVISSPEKLAVLLDEIPSPHLQVVFDPVNLLSADNHLDQQQVIERSLRAFGDRIAVVHAKDFRMVDRQIQFCPAGTGQMDYSTILSWLVKQLPSVAILLEEAGPDAAGSSQTFIRNHLQSSIT
jgi:L-ribulose-5-phosphate 3-epimerase